MASTIIEPAKGNAPDSADADMLMEPTESLRHFFKPEDWLAALFTTLISGLTFFYYMAPEVTLQDSGELVTGAFTFGVPHPPGYPLWALMGYLWSHFIVPFGNPAWRITMMSVVTGALTVGLMTIIMTRSLRLLLHSLPWGDSVDERLQHWMALFIGVACALFFGFNRGVWLWACVSEMRVLNVFSFVLTSCIFFAWMIQPHRRGFLYALLLIFGLSLSNHQTIAVMAIPFAVGVFLTGLDQFMDLLRRKPQVQDKFSLFMRSQFNFFELGIASCISFMVGLIIWAWLTPPPGGTMMASTINLPLINKAVNTLGFAAFCGTLAAIGLVVATRTGWWKWSQALTGAGMLIAGVSVYIYMPFAAWTNPPMNWGYAATKEGFVHAVTRGQYEKLNAASFFSQEFFLKIKLFIEAMVNQYSLPLTLLGLVTPLVILYVWFQCKPRGRSWMIFVWTAFLISSLGLLTIINPKLDRQDQEINIKFFAPAHGFYAMLIGYGIAVIFSVIAWKQKVLGGWFVRLACIALLAIPLVTYQKNLALCNLRGHDFGYLFGYLMFKPGNGYPDMEKDAVLYGGTDPGRFVPTYMIFCESRVAPKDRYRDPDFDRSDVYIITQNALADNTYMSYIRDHYDYSRPKNDGPFQKLLRRDSTYPVQPIYIPSGEDNNRAFQEYVKDVQTGKIPASADIKIENGRVSVQGVGGVMTINGILARWIFDRNKDKHAFYIEESYVIPWMYAYLTPFGVIMKIEKDPVPPPQENPKLWADIVARDRKYWDKLTQDFLAREEFRRNSDAKKSFSKMRSALAGLYAARGLIGEAEYAFKQSRELCPESPEACFRLSDLYMRQQRFEEAAQVMEAYLVLDPYNRNAANFLQAIRGSHQDNTRRKVLEESMGKGKLDFGNAMELAGIYLKLGMEGQFQGLSRGLIDSPALPPEASLTVARFMEANKRWDLRVYALQKYLTRDPAAFKSWIDLSYAQLIINKPQEAFASLKRSIEVGGEVARSLLREDPRFEQLREAPPFKALVPPLKKPPALGGFPLMNPGLQP
jgi:tetratricopeptide (TPR) repeat protein